MTTAPSRRSVLGLALAGPALITSCARTSAKTPVHVAVLDTGVGEAPQFVKYEIVREGADPGDDHGTQVASLILGAGGVATPSIPPERVMLTSINITRGNVPALDLLTAGLYRCIDMKVDVANISLGVRQPNGPLEEAVTAAMESGVLVVASAGNVRFMAPDYPARYPPALSVGAVDDEGQRYALSPEGTDVTAPGVDLAVLDRRGRESRQSGVSLATAVVTNDVTHRLLDARIDSATDYRERNVQLP